MEQSMSQHLQKSERIQIQTGLWLRNLRCDAKVYLKQENFQLHHYISFVHQTS